MWYDGAKLSERKESVETLLFSVRKTHNLQEMLSRSLSEASPEHI
jgi:hypothetical protein